MEIGEIYYSTLDNVKFTNVRPQNTNNIPIKCIGLGLSQYAFGNKLHIAKKYYITSNIAGKESPSYYKMIKN